MAPLESSRVSVTAWPPPAEATEPWFLMATEKATFCPADGAEGEVLTPVETRSELATGFTTRPAALV